MNTSKCISISLAAVVLALASTSVLAGTWPAFDQTAAFFGGIITAQNVAFLATFLLAVAVLGWMFNFNGLAWVVRILIGLSILGSLTFIVQLFLFSGGGF